MTHPPGAGAEPQNHSLRWAMNPRPLISFFDWRPMTYHRVLLVPAAQISVGDVVLTFPTSSMDRVFVGHGIPERESVIEQHLDPADGDVYIKTNNAAQYCAPYEHIHLDCFLTFGKNTA